MTVRMIERKDGYSAMISDEGGRTFLPGHGKSRVGALKDLVERIEKTDRAPGPGRTSNKVWLARVWRSPKR